MTRKINAACLKYSLVLSIFISAANAQNKKIDSLLSVLKKQQDDTNKIKTLNNVASEFMALGNYDSAFFFSTQALNAGEKHNYTAGAALALSNRGIVCRRKGDFAEALKNLFGSLRMWETIDGKKGISNCYNNIGNVYSDLGNYSEALKNHIASLNIRLALNDKKGIGTSYGNIGLLYHDMGNIPDALKNLFASLKVREAIGDKDGIATTFINLGRIYRSQGNYSEAFKYHYASLKIREAQGNKSNIANALGNIGSDYLGQADSAYRKGNKTFAAEKYALALNYYMDQVKMEEAQGDKYAVASTLGGIGVVYWNQGKYDEALKSYLGSIKIREEIGDKSGMAGTYINIANLKLTIKEYAEAKKYFDKGIEISKEIGQKEWLRNAYNNLSFLESEQGDFKSALKHFQLYVNYRDSLTNEENTKVTVQQQMLYDFDKKENSRKAEQEKKDVLSAEELKQQKLQRNYFIVGFVLTALLAVFILRSFLLKKKANKLLEEKNHTIAMQKELVEEKQKEILDSIYYARRIQRALITSEKNLGRMLSAARKTNI